MIVDIDRAILKLLSDHERRALLDRVKLAGGAETVNKTTVKDLLHRNAGLREAMENAPNIKRPDLSEASAAKKFEAADELAFAVLELIGKHLPTDEDTEENKFLKEQLKARIEAKRTSKKTPT